MSYVNRISCFGREVDKGKYAETDNFVHCEEIVRRAEYLLITNHRMIYAQRNDMFGVWNVSEAWPISIYIYLIFMLFSLRLLSPCGRISGRKWTVL